MSAAATEVRNPKTHAGGAVLRPRLPLWQRLRIFGSGAGIAVGEDALYVAILRARPSGPVSLATRTITGFRSRPAAEWGSELSRFISSAGASGVAVTVILPRSEVVVRTLNLPGVGDKDVPSAIDLQVDTLHPWGDVDVVSAWTRISKTAILVAFTRKDTLPSYETLFAEAGVPLASLTLAPAAIHSALRLWNTAPASLLCIYSGERGKTEIYGESESRPVFSAEFASSSERALSLARAELRLSSDFEGHSLAEALPVVPGPNPAESYDLAYAAALAGVAPRLAPHSNFLPPERRASHSRIQYAIPAALAVLVALAILTGFVIFPAIEQKRYRDDLNRAARQLEPAALRAQTIEKQIASERTRITLLDDLKRRPQADLDVLSELTRLLPPPVWTATIEIYPDSVVISGEADQAAPLLKTLDSSPLFEKSEFTLSVTRNSQQQTEQFRIKTMRRGRAGRTTP